MSSALTTASSARTCLQRACLRAGVCDSHSFADATARLRDCAASFSTILHARWHAPTRPSRLHKQGSEQMASVALTETFCFGCICGLGFLTPHTLSLPPNHLQEGLDDPVGGLTETDSSSFRPCSGPRSRSRAEQMMRGLNCPGLLIGDGQATNH